MKFGRKLFVLCCSVSIFASAASQGQDAAVHFSKDIWPILAERCIQCHGEYEQEGELRLDSPDFIRKGGDFGEILDTDAPEASTLLELVMLPDGDSDKMPGKGDPLSKEEIDLLQRWIETGASFEGWTPELQAAANDAVKKNKVEPDWSTTVPAVSTLPSRPIMFNKDVRQILSDNCYKCHGPDQNKRKANLRFDLEEQTPGEREGGAVIVPGDVLNSEFVRRIFHPDVDERMPPEKSEKFLTEEEKNVLAAWVQQGGEYESHWVYEPLVRPEVPNGTRQGFDSNPIDRFILAELEKNNLRPSPKADPYTLARRLSYDLTGLPVAVEQAERLKEEGNASSLIARYLNSPQYGEKMAVHWLDVVRYADSNGYHSDEERTIWAYRDYVINAFNNNKPFDVFTREQLAGDLLDGHGQEQLVASGFNRLNQITAEGGAQPKEYRAIYNADRVRSIGTVWMGLTLGCAECHSHKFDPVTDKDFYSMAAFFADVEETDVYPGRSGWAPFMHLPDDKHRRAVAEIDREIERTRSVLATPSAETVNALKEWLRGIRKTDEKKATGWIPIEPNETASEKGTAFTMLSDLTVQAAQIAPSKDTLSITLKTDLENITALRLEAVPHPEFKKILAKHSNSNHKATIEVFEKGSESAVRLAKSESTAKLKSSTLKDKKENEISKEELRFDLSVDGFRNDIQFVFEFQEPLAGGKGTELVLKLGHTPNRDDVWSPFSRLRVSLSTSSIPSLRDTSEAPEFVTRLLATNRPKKLLDNLDVTGYFLSITPSLEESRKALDETYKKRRDELQAVPTTLITRALETPRVTRILPRGNWMDDSGDVVTPAIPDALPALNIAGGEGVPTRLDLANWITHKNNPLTARVVMNRLWKQFFGRGLSGVLDDLGSQGEWPTHPELLDWLSVEFVESGWDMKHMVRLITSSSTYQQASNVSREKWDQDPENNWYARQSSYRVEAEGVRDIALQLGGLLNEDIGGPSGRPYQPEGYWQHLNFPKRVYAHDENANQYRRGLYVHWQRSFLHPSMMAFDAPSREECVAERVSSNTPLQALALMNDPTYVEAARGFGERIMREGGATVNEKLEWALRQAIVRTPSAAEIDIMNDIFLAHRAEYDRDEELTAAVFSTGMYRTPEDLNLSELAAWTSVARVIFNLHETITRS
jgi:mono/diheme cytochrome c family protein